MVRRVDELLLNLFCINLIRKLFQSEIGDRTILSTHNINQASVALWGLTRGGLNIGIEMITSTATTIVIVIMIIVTLINPFTQVQNDISQCRAQNDIMTSDVYIRSREVVPEHPKLGQQQLMKRTKRVEDNLGKIYQLICKE